jgi:hypothetical protein
MDEKPRRREAVESPEDIAYLLDTVSEKVPAMIKGIIGAFFSPEAAKDMAKSVAEFRKTLIEGGSRRTRQCRCPENTCRQ